MKKLLLCLAATAGIMTANAADGDTFEAGDLKYTITSEAEGTVAVSGSVNALSSLTEVTIPMTVEYNDVTYFVTSIADKAFYGVTKLMTLNLPESIFTIGSMAFYNCKLLTSIVLPNSVTSVGSSAFRTCYVVKTLKLSSGCNNYGSNAFNGAMEIVDLTIPACVDGPITLGSAAFSSMTELTNLYLPGEYNKFGSYAIGGFGGLNVYLYSQTPFVGSFNPANKVTTHVSSEEFAEWWIENGGTGWNNGRWVYDLDSHPWEYVTSLTLPETATATIGINTKLNSETRAASSDVVWRSSDISVAFVDQQGNVYPRKEGKVTISASAASSSNTVVKAECELTVKSDDPVGVATIEAENAERIFNLQGVEMNANTTLPAGIYVKGGKKIIVK